MLMCYSIVHKYYKNKTNYQQQQKNEELNNKTNFFAHKLFKLRLCAVFI